MSCKGLSEFLNDLLIMYNKKSLNKISDANKNSKHDDHDKIVKDTEIIESHATQHDTCHEHTSFFPYHYLNVG